MIAIIARLKIMPIICALAVMAVGGCAQTHWAKPSGNAAQLNYDQTSCDQLARQRNHDYESRPGGIVVSEYVEDCMEYFGWTRQRDN